LGGVKKGTLMLGYLPISTFVGADPFYGSVLF